MNLTKCMKDRCMSSLTTEERLTLMEQYLFIYGGYWGHLKRVKKQTRI